MANLFKIGSRRNGKSWENAYDSTPMKRSTGITTLFLDIGGVLLTDGWGNQYRTLAARTFDLNP